MRPNVPQPASAPRRLRKDAEANRNRILEAAREVFAGRGLDATLHEVADHAGVGIGTVYRRFRNKDEVLKAIFEQEIAQVVAVAQQALECEDPWIGFQRFFLHMARQFALDRGLREVVLSGSAGQISRQDRDPLVPIFAAIIKRAQDAGALRAGLEPSDLPPIAHMLSAAIYYTRPVNSDVWRRYALIFLDGLRPEADSGQALPTALTLEEVETLLGFRTATVEARTEAPRRRPRPHRSD
jgi:AcrR family transcriptional regulator